MQSKVGAGIVAGLVGGVVFGVMMQMMSAPDPEGLEIPMMVMVARVVGSDSTLVGWVYHLFNSALIGGIFGGLLGTRSTTYGAGIGLGAVYGLGWWVLGGLVLMPMLLGMPAFAPLSVESMRPVAIGSFVGHLVYGLITGAVFVGILRRGKVVQITEERSKRVA